MPMRASLLIYLMIFVLALQAAGQRVTVSGYVTDASSGERMIDATVYEKASFAGTTTNNYGDS